MYGNDPKLTARSKMGIPSIDDVRAEASRVAFGARLVQNNLRALVAEVIVDYALQSAWERCSGDWKGWDFKHRTDDTHLELKQSARRQTWSSAGSPQSPRFDIAERAGYYEGSVWTAHKGRNADIYVFGFHPRDDETADHRDAAQWVFYVVPVSKLPLTKPISLSALNTLSAVYTWDQLFEIVERERLALIKKML
jgi:hypothetical protein